MKNLSELLQSLENLDETDLAEFQTSMRLLQQPRMSAPGGKAQPPIIKKQELMENLPPNIKLLIEGIEEYYLNILTEIGENRDIDEIFKAMEKDFRREYSSYSAREYSHSDAISINPVKLNLLIKSLEMVSPDAEAYHFCITFHSVLASENNNQSGLTKSFQGIVDNKQYRMEILENNFLEINAEIKRLEEERKNIGIQQTNPHNDERINDANNKLLDKRQEILVSLMQLNETKNKLLVPETNTTYEEACQNLLNETTAEHTKIKNSRLSVEKNIEKEIQENIEKIVQLKKLCQQYTEHLTPEIVQKIPNVTKADIANYVKYELQKEEIPKDEEKNIQDSIALMNHAKIDGDLCMSKLIAVNELQFSLTSHRPRDPNNKDVFENFNAVLETHESTLKSCRSLWQKIIAIILPESVRASHASFFKPKGEIFTEEVKIISKPPQPGG